MTGLYETEIFKSKNLAVDTSYESGLFQLFYDARIDEIIWLVILGLGILQSNFIQYGLDSFDCRVGNPFVKRRKHPVGFLENLSIR